MGKCASKERIGKSLHSRVRTLPAKRPTTTIIEEERQPFFVHDTDSPQLLSARTSADNRNDEDVLDETPLSRVPVDDSKGSTSAIPNYGLSNSLCDAKDDLLPDFPLLDPQGHPIVQYHRDISSATPNLAFSTTNYLEISSSVREGLIQREPSATSPLDKSDGGDHTHVLNLTSVDRDTVLTQTVGAVVTVTTLKPALELDTTARGIASPLEASNERDQSQLMNLCSTERKKEGEADKNDPTETIGAVETFNTVEPTLHLETTASNLELKEKIDDISEKSSLLEGVRGIETGVPRSVDIDGIATEGSMEVEGPAQALEAVLPQVVASTVKVLSQIEIPKEYDTAEQQMQDEKIAKGDSVSHTAGEPVASHVMELETEMLPFIPAEQERLPSAPVKEETVGPDGRVTTDPQISEVPTTLVPHLETGNVNIIDTTLTTDSTDALEKTTKLDVTDDFLQKEKDENDHALENNLASLAEAESGKPEGATEELEFMARHGDVPVEPAQLLEAKQDNQEERLTHTEESVLTDMYPEESGVEPDRALEERSHLLYQPKIIETSIEHEEADDIESNLSTIVEPDDDRDAEIALEDVSTLSTDEQMDDRETAATPEEEGEPEKMEDVEMPLEPEIGTLLSRQVEKLQEREADIAMEVSSDLVPDKENQAVTEIPVIAATQEEEIHSSGTLTSDAAAEELQDSTKELEEDENVKAELQDSAKEDENVDVAIKEDRETENMFDGLTTEKKQQELINEETASSEAQIECSVPLHESVQDTAPSDAETDIDWEKEPPARLPNIDEIQQEAIENSEMLLVATEALREHVEGEIQKPESQDLAHDEKFYEEIAKTNTIESEPSQQRAETNCLDLQENNASELQDGSAESIPPQVQEEGQPEVDEQELVTLQTQENDASELQDGSEQDRQTELAREAKNYEETAGPNASELEPSQQTDETNPPKVQENTESELQDGSLENTPPELQGKNQPDMDEQEVVTSPTQEIDVASELQDWSEQNIPSQPQGDTDVDEQEVVTSPTQEIDVASELQDWSEQNIPSQPQGETDVDEQELAISQTREIDASELQNVVEQKTPPDSHCELDEHNPAASQIVIPNDIAEEGLPAEVSEQQDVKPSGPQGGHSRSIDAEIGAEPELQEHAPAPIHVADEDSNTQQTSESIEQDTGAPLEAQECTSNNTVEEIEPETNLQESPETQDAASAESIEQDTSAPLETQESNSSNTVETNLQELPGTQDAATPISEENFNAQQASETIEKDTGAQLEPQEISSSNTGQESPETHYPAAPIHFLDEGCNTHHISKNVEQGKGAPLELQESSSSNTVEETESETKLQELPETQDAATPIHVSEDSNTQQTSETIEQDTGAQLEPQESSSSSIIEEKETENNLRELEEIQDSSSKDVLQQRYQDAPEQIIPTSELQDKSSDEPGVETGEAAPTQDAKSIDISEEEAKEDREAAKQGLEEPLELQSTSKDLDIKQTEEQQDNTKKDANTPVEGSSEEPEVEVREAPPTQDVNSNDTSGEECITQQTHEDPEGAKQGLQEPSELQNKPSDLKIRQTEEQQEDVERDKDMPVESHEDTAKQTEEQQDDAGQDTDMLVEIQEDSSPDRVVFASKENEESQMRDDDTEQKEMTGEEADIIKRKAEGSNELENEDVSSLQATLSDEVAAIIIEEDASTKSEAIPAEDDTELEQHS